MHVTTVSSYLLRTGNVVSLAFVVLNLELPCSSQSNVLGNGTRKTRSGGLSEQPTDSEYATTSNVGLHLFWHPVRVAIQREAKINKHNSPPKKKKERKTTISPPVKLWAKGRVGQPARITGSVKGCEQNLLFTGKRRATPS